MTNFKNLLEKFLTLKFEDLQSELLFQNSYFENTINQMRMGLFGIACMASGFTVTFLGLLPQSPYRLLLLSHPMILPVLLVGLASIYIFMILGFSFTSFFEKHWAFILIGIATFFGIILTTRLMYASEFGKLLLHFAFFMLMVWLYALSGLTFSKANLTFFLIFLGFTVAAFLKQPSYGTYFYYSFNIALLAAINSLIGFMIEKKARQTFYKSHFNSPGKIIRTIAFSEENREPGLIILNGFNKVLNEKYPIQNINTSLEQNALKVTLTIQAPEGEKENIEKYLEEYASMIINNTPISNLINDSINAKLLEMELKHAKEIYDIKKLQFQNSINQQNQKIDHLEELVKQLTPQSF